MRYDMALIRMRFDKPDVATRPGGDPAKFLESMQRWAISGPSLVFDISAIAEDVLQAS